MLKLFFAFAISVCVMPALASPYSVNDFLFSSSLSEAKTSLREVNIPLALYEKMQRSDFGDLRVFNADGQIVPHQFSQPLQPHQREKSKLEALLVFYPLSREEASKQRNVQVIINQHNGSQSVSINQHLATTPKKREYQYIIENNKQRFSQPLCKLKLDWKQNKENAIISFKLESSNELQKWRTLSHRLIISKLKFTGSQLKHDEVSFDCTSQKYLRLTWFQPKQISHLIQIKGVYSQAKKQITQWTVFDQPRFSEEDGSWLFESKVNTAITSMEFIASHDGLFYKGVLYSRTNDKQAWRYRGDFSQYRLNMGDTTLISSPFTFSSPISDRYWKTVLKTEGRLSDSQLPVIKAGWSPRKLFFLAQGKGPFKLAFGNASVLPAQNNDLLGLLQGIKDSGANIEKVSLEKIVKKDLVKVLEPKELSWKLILLWLVLILGTALMAAMAYRLYQQMGEDYN